MKKEILEICPELKKYKSLIKDLSNGIYFESLQYLGFRHKKVPKDDLAAIIDKLVENNYLYYSYKFFCGNDGCESDICFNNKKDLIDYLADKRDDYGNIFCSKCGAKIKPDNIKKTIFKVKGE